MKQSFRNIATQTRLSQNLIREFTGSSLTAHRDIEEYQAGIITFAELQNRLTEIFTLLHGEINFIATGK